MKLFLNYFILEFKKSIKLLKKSILGMLLMLTLLMFGVAAVSSAFLKAQVFQQIHVAVIVPEGDRMTRMAMQYISSMDSVKSICRFRYMDRAAAMAGLREGEVQAVIELPENFYEDVDSGKNTPACIYFPDRTGQDVELFRELLTDGVSMLQTAEAGVYASLYAADCRQAQAGKEQIGNRVALLYMKEVLHRGEIFGKSVCSPIGEVKYGQYYYSAAVLLALLMCGLNFGFLYRRQERAVAQKLGVYGMGAWKLSFVKILVMAAVLWMIACLLYLEVCLMSVSAASAAGFLRFHAGTIFGLLFLSMAMASYFHMIYGAVGNGLHGAAVLFAVNIIMIIGSGLLVPAAYLPGAVGKIGELLPLNLWSQFHLKLMFGTVSRKDMVPMSVWLAAGTGIGAVGSAWRDRGPQGHLYGGDGSILLLHREQADGGNATRKRLTAVPLNWYRLWLKAYWRKKAYWLQTAAMVFLLAVISGTSVPDGKNVAVGIYCGESSLAQDVLQALEGRETMFEFRGYDSEDGLYRDVTAGKAECGFLFGADFDRRAERGDLEEAVTYICTPFTVKGEVARETVYASWLRIYSDQMLTNSEKNIFGNVREERRNALLEKNHDYQEGEKVFRLQTETLDAESRETMEETAEPRAFPIQGTAGLFVFLMMLLAYGRKFEAKGNGVEKALDRRRRLLYGYISSLAAGTLPAAAGTAAILFLTGNGRAVTETALMLVLLFISGIWIAAVGSLMRRDTSFLSGAAVFTAASLLICPVFLNLYGYVPALKYISCIFPLGIYLNLHLLFL